MRNKYKTIVVSIAGGIGDGLILIPFINKLRAKYPNHFIYGVFTQRITFEVFENLQILDYLILANKSQLLISKILFKDKYYSSFLISPNVVIASLVSFKKITILYSVLYGIKKYLYYTPNIRWLKLGHNKPIMESNLLLLECESFKQFLSPAQGSVRSLVKHVNVNKNRNLNFALQMFSDEIYKNLPFYKWKIIIKSILRKYPTIKITLIGNKYDTAILKDSLFNNQSIINMMGKTNINQVMNIIKKSDFFLGLDSGLMHLAYYYSVPTFTVWGPTDNIAYGYKNDPKHYQYTLQKKCSPCESPIRIPIQPLYTDPRECPTKNCLSDISPVDLSSRLFSFLEEII